ncbi:hypothetical protein G7Z17_g3973 [Cylindrodendrum hubeiense]|uniref:Uncharacterized protein n=1 Tax=Cylindrodendrum hubeiense TaxID=595255 RepID=A0A9P5HDK7_9HYPO|nr:hypothetical protein G7Z17_g3973 [Cylindrodendrum hubeiense]
MQAEDTRPTGDSTALTTRYIKYADENPSDFLNYLRTVWESDAASVIEDPSAMATLKETKVLCETGDRWPLSRTYLRVPKLVSLCEGYMLENERFPFLKLQKPPTLDDDLGSWAFLKSDFGVGTRNDLNFYLDILRFIRQKNRRDQVKLPRRILQLYLRIHATCEASSDSLKAQQKVREVFGKTDLILRHGWWHSLNTCFLELPGRPRGWTFVFPPEESWNANDAECAELRQFYQQTLKIPNAISLKDILDRLDTARDDVSPHPNLSLEKLYGAIDEMMPRLPESDAIDLRSSFENKPYIRVLSNGSVGWHKLAACVWAPGLNIPGKVDLSVDYGRLESFFTESLKVSSGFRMVYDHLVNLDPEVSPVESVKTMIWSLNESLSEHGHLLDPAPFRSSSVFPVKNTNGQVKLSSAEAEFSIPDKEFIQEQFSGMVEMLDFTAHEVWLLEPLMVWAGLESRYISWNVAEASYLDGASAQPITGGFSPARSRGLVRIATHFRSPRVKTVQERQKIIRILERSSFFQTDGMYLQLALSTNNNGVSTVDKIPGHLHIEDCDDRLKIYVPHGEDPQEFCFASKLPRRLIEWIMTDPASEVIGRVDEVAVGLVKTIMTIRDGLIDSVLDAEGIVLVEGLSSPVSDSPNHCDSKPAQLGSRRIIVPRGKRSRANSTSPSTRPSSADLPPPGYDEIPMESLTVKELISEIESK